jgi:hypothetical protein
MIFTLIKDGRKHYLCMKDRLWNMELVVDTGCFFSIEKLMFSKRLTTDDMHSIIEKELVDLVCTLKEGEEYSYDEMIRPLIREAKLKKIGL